ncbi:MAG: cobalt transporter CbiM [Atopobiaceae bacterium]|nr:cobalt transporter CbiM [Atopobiaceae bacterium]
MHIPDNYLSPATDAVLAVAMVPIWVRSARKVQEELDQRQVSFIGMAAAFSFLLMMFNVPLPGGTTGHAVGGTLIACLLGPHAACLAVSVALGIQAVLFGDGGILAFGANCFNMAFVLPFVGYACFRLIAGSAPSPGRRMVALFVGSYVGLNVAALVAAIEFGIQPLLFHDAAGQALYCPYPLSVSVPAMCIPHLLVAGVVEGVATVAIYEFVARVAPEYLVHKASEKPLGKGSLVPVMALVAALVVATPLGLMAEGTAWGEWGADEIAETGAGYVPAGFENGFEWEALMPDYSFGGLPDAVAYILSAVAGVALLVIAFKLVSSFVGKRDMAAA